MSTIKVGTLLAADGTTTTQPSIPALDKRMASAWVQFSGTGTVAVNEAYNVSSITDNGTGDYSANFQTNLSTAYYAVTGSTIGSGGYYSTFTCGGSASTSAARIKIQHINNNLYDNSAISLIVMAP